MEIRTRSLATLAGALLITGAAFASPITPSYTSFGTLGAATFGGNGIPNNAVAITTFGDLTLGLTAHQRYDAAPVTSDGAGTFTAQAGVSQVSPSPADPHATWNFGFYIGGLDASRYAFSLFYDFDPAAGTDDSVLGRTISPPGSVTTTAQNSWNLGMNFLATSVPGLIAPTYASFDPTAAGQYSFALVAYTVGAGNVLTEVARSAILVNVVPEPGSLALAGLALVALGFARRRKV